VARAAANRNAKWPKRSIAGRRNTRAAGRITARGSPPIETIDILQFVPPLHEPPAVEWMARRPENQRGHAAIPQAVPPPFRPVSLSAQPDNERFVPLREH